MATRRIVPVRINTDRKRVIVVFEMLDYDYLQKCNTPNIDSLNPYPAWSYGATTRASVLAILGGFLPQPAIEDHPNTGLFNKWTDPYTLTNYKNVNALFLYVPNGWITELLEPFIRPDLKRLVMKWHTYHDTRDMINDFLKRKEKRGIEGLEKPGYYAYFHILETHDPFYPEERGIVGYDERRKASVEYCDRILKPLIDLEEIDDLIILSDHNGGGLQTSWHANEAAEVAGNKYDAILGLHPIKVFMATRIKPGPSKVEKWP